MEAVIAIVVLAIRGGIGYLIGKNRNIGGVWAFILGVVLGLIGWIIAACSKKVNIPMFDDMSEKGGHQ
jgi:hypothetical protein